MADNNENSTPSTEPKEEIVLGEAEPETPEPPVMERREASASNGLKRAIFDVPIEVIVSVGKAQPLIGDLLAMGRNDLLPLEASIDDPVELLVKGRVIAKGELTQSPQNEGQLGVRLTEVINIASLTE